jgi:hypothetical protein
MSMHASDMVLSAGFLVFDRMPVSFDEDIVGHAPLPSIEMAISALFNAVVKPTEVNCAPCSAPIDKTWRPIEPPRLFSMITDKGKAHQFALATFVAAARVNVTVAPAGKLYWNAPSLFHWIVNVFELLLLFVTTRTSLLSGFLKA